MSESLGTAPVPPAVEKRELRHRMRRHLEEAGAERRQDWAAEITRRALALPAITNARGVLSCLSYGTEVDTWDLARRLAAERALFVPRADPADGSLHVHPYPCDLVTLPFGLRQPPRNTPEIPTSRIADEVDVVLVLGLAFDEDGYRLGHGGGYFDRFLAAHPIPAIGLAFEAQRLPRVPREPHDVPMSALVTEAETVELGRPPRA